MPFWIGWPLWQKLSFVLAILLAVVLIYSFCVLAYNRRMIKRHAAEEAERREAEKYPILSESSDIPFGAKALERGVHVEGIWTTKRHSLVKQTSPSEVGRQESLGSTLKQKSTTSTVVAPPSSPASPVAPVLTNESGLQCTSRGETDATETGELESIHIDTFRASRPPQLEIYERARDAERPRSRGWFASRSSWMTKPFEGHRRMSVREGNEHNRTSSEDFRRRFSKLFDENAPVRPAEMFQLKPIYQESIASKGSLDTNPRDNGRGHI